MHPFSNSLRFSDVFKGVEKGCIETNGIIRLYLQGPLNEIVTSPNTHEKIRSNCFQCHFAISLKTFYFYLIFIFFNYSCTRQHSKEVHKSIIVPKSNVFTIWHPN